MDFLARLDNIKMNFIVGHGRSGTTMLVFVLNQHKQCIAAPEILHFILFHKKYRYVKEVTQALLDDYIAYLKVVYTSKKRFFLDACNPQVLDYLKIGTPITYSRLSKLVYLTFFKGKNIPEEITCIVDKNPFYTFHIEKIRSVFPDARLLFMVRDYRGYILSNLQSQNPVVGKRSLAYYAITWNYYLNELRKAQLSAPGTIKVMRYEDLALNREKEIADIVAFFGLSFTPELMNFNETIQRRFVGVDKIKLANAHFVKRLMALSQPINTQKVNEWKIKLTNRQIACADYFCAKNGQLVGYAAEYKISFFRKIIYRISSVPAYIRVGLFMFLNSPQLFYKLNIKNKLERESNFLSLNENHG